MKISTSESRIFISDNMIKRYSMYSNMPYFILCRYYMLSYNESTNKEILSDIEFNIYECFHEKYENARTAEERQLCQSTFKELLPTSNYDVTKNLVANGILKPKMVESYLERRLATLQDICAQIQEKQNLS